MNPLVLYPTIAAPIGLAGGIRAHMMSEDDRRLIRSYYGEDPNSNTRLKNTGRGLFGAAIGSVTGGGAGALLDRAGSTIFGFKPKPIMLPIGAVAGAMYGTKKMTDRYSSYRAQRIRERLWRDYYERRKRTI